MHKNSAADRRRLKDDLEASPIWRHPIRCPTMLSSLRFVFQDGMVTGHGAGFENFSPSKQKRALVAYWKGIRATYPQAFAKKHRHQYNLQSRVGVQVFHRVFPEVLTAAVRDSSATNAVLYEAILHSALFPLGGRNLHGARVCGLDFWRVGASGASDAYDNAHGYDLLAEQIALNLVFSPDNARSPKP